MHPTVYDPVKDELLGFDPWAGAIHAFRIGDGEERVVARVPITNDHTIEIGTAYDLRRRLLVMAYPSNLDDGTPVPDPIKVIDLEAGGIVEEMDYPENPFGDGDVLHLNQGYYDVAADRVVLCGSTASSSWHVPRAFWRFRFVE
jgi:hypothetical protein